MKEVKKPFTQPLTAPLFQHKSMPLCGRNSVVECHLAKVNVEGSSPFARSTEPLEIPGVFLFLGISVVGKVGLHNHLHNHFCWLGRRPDLGLLHLAALL